MQLRTLPRRELGHPTSATLGPNRAARWPRRVVGTAAKVVGAASRRKRDLLASEERLSLLVDATREYAIYTLNPDGIIATWNAGAERLKGYTADEILGQHFSIFYSSIDRASGHPERELEKARINGRYTEEAWRIRKDGTLFWANVVITALYDDSGNVRGFSKVTRDLTERRNADEALRASEVRFRSAFNDAPTAAALIDIKGRMVQVNHALAELIGYRPELLLTMNYLDIVYSGERGLDSDGLRSLFDGTIRSYSRDSRYVDADGTVIWVNAHIVPVPDAKGFIHTLLSHALDITQQRRYEEQLVELASHDVLTGLANRAKFREELTSHLDRCRRYGLTGAVLMLDLDNFKRVNDSLGHNAGDELIISVATLLRSRMRSADVVARLGGDEFAILLPEGGRDAAENVASAIVQAVRDDVTELDGGRPRTITVSIGIAAIDNAEVSAHELLAEADLAMYDAKEAGRDRYAFYADDTHTVARNKARITWSERIEDALENDGFELWAQPILDLGGARIDSHELLLRMRAPDGETITPGQFLYIAERVGLIGEIDRWVTTQAIDLLARVQVVYPNHRLEINLSGLSIGDESLRDHIAETISAHTVDPSGLVFEITETAAVQHVVAARDFADALREFGCQFALDDFGAGFGSFYYLKHLPFDYVKIDGEFIATCMTNLADKLIIESVVSIAKGLGKRTIAEFVGDDETQQFLQRQGVDYAQGYYIGRPVPIDDAFPDLPATPDPKAPLGGPISVSTIPVAIDLRVSAVRAGEDRWLSRPA